MKLIIDISEEAKKHIDTFKGKFLCGDGCDMIEAIQKGTPYYNCSTCKFASIHCTEYDTDVDALDGCSNWEGD